MPYKDQDRAMVASKERKRRWRERLRPADWKDQRGQHGNHAKGDRHPRWSRDQIMSKGGYVKVRVGKDHPLADPNGYAYEHLVVWCAAGNPRPEQGKILHHKNENKTDNRLSNLELLDRSAHTTLHNAGRPRDKSGRFCAGRLLDGREWSEMPKEARNA